VRRVNRSLPGGNLANGYGLTETSGRTTGIGGADFRAKPDSVGLSVCDVRIADRSFVSVIRLFTSRRGHLVSMPTSTPESVAET
jgi:long-subunit acyl-CoA synthetase (AMP-forming)